MDIANNTFISSTMFTERIGFVAALKTIEVICENKVWEHLIKIGNQIGESWLYLANKYSLNLKVNEFKPLISFNLQYKEKNNLIYTIFIQEMLKRGYLAGSQVATSFAYNKIIIKNYLKAVDEVFYKIKIYLDKGKLPLKGEVKHSTFRRLTG